MPKIPCTLAILTRNSGTTLRRALEGAREFGDILVCDGGSQDDTLAIAGEFNARVISQDTAFLNPDGSIKDFAGIRNQTLAAAKEPWFFFLDSDEELSQELVDEVRQRCAGAPAAYWVPRRYLWRGMLIASSTTYPNRQMRFFSKEAVEGFIKPVHERIVPRADTPTLSLTNPMLVVLEDDRIKLWRRWRRYIELEAARIPAITWSGWLRVVRFHVFASLRYLLRLPIVYLFSPGPRLPLWRELAEHRYNAMVVQRLYKNIQ